jgi:hypothetical protein
LRCLVFDAAAHAFIMSRLILNNVFDRTMLTEQAPLAAAVGPRSSNIPAAFAT